MKNFLVAFIIFLVWSFFGLWLYSWVGRPINTSDSVKDSIATQNTNQTNDVDQTVELPGAKEITNAKIDTLQLKENTTEIKDTIAITKGLKAINQNNDIIFLFEQGIALIKNTAVIEIPVDIVDFKYKINTYLIEHKDEELEILSFYDASENIEMPNFGMQRGRKVKDILIETGIESERIVVRPIIKSLPFDNSGKLANGITFNFKPLDEERIELLKSSLPESKTLYPNFVNNDIFVNEPLQNLLDEAKTVLSKNPSAVIEVIGHTDNIGNANDNYLLGLNYARQVRWYLVNKGGINTERVIASSAGESKSIATNATERGRTLNRRIEIIYKNR